MEKSSVVKVGAIILLVAALVIWMPGQAGFGARVGGNMTLNAISYNPAPAAWEHAPLSSAGLIGLTHASPALLSSGSFVRPSAQINPTSSIASNAVRFIDDSSYIAQSETSVFVDPSNTEHVVGTFNDGRWFFCPALTTADCPSGFQISISGFSVSTDGGSTVLKTGDLPGLLYASSTNKNFIGFLVSWGDPSVAATVDGNFYYATLAIDPVTGNNGIELSKSNGNLFDSTHSCASPNTAPWTNSCWSSTLVFGNLSGMVNRGKATHVPTSFEDKELIAVDRDASSSFYGDVYISWDHFFEAGTSATYAARCTPSLSCTMLSGGSLPVISGTDPFVAFSTPTVGSDGSVFVSWCNYGTATTLGPVSCRITASGAGGASFGAIHTILSFEGAGTTFPSDNGLVGFATEQFRTGSVPVVAADTSGGSSNVYFTIAVCSAGNYYAFNNPALPGNCGDSSVLFSSSGDGGATWSSAQTVSPSAVNFQPWVTVDPTNGHVVVTYYTTEFDAFNHRADVVASVSTDQGQTFTTSRLTNVSDEPNADPVLFDYFTQFGGAFVVPQFGDYQQASAVGGTIYDLFSGNYAEELGTFQTDPFLVTGSD